MSSATDHPETITDAIVDEVRAIREKICQQFGNDVDRLCDHLQDLEQTHPERLVKPGTRRTRAQGHGQADDR